MNVLKSQDVLKALTSQFLSYVPGSRGYEGTHNSMAQHFRYYDVGNNNPDNYNQKLKTQYQKISV